jgi:putative transposase
LWNNGLGEQSDRKLQEPPLSTADHRPCGLAVFSIPFEPKDGRGGAAGARYDPEMGSQFGTAYARQLCRKRPLRKNIWHLDGVVISIGGREHWLWRAVDQDDYVLDEIVQAHRDTQAPRRLLVRLLKRSEA